MRTTMAKYEQLQELIAEWERRSDSTTNFPVHVDAPHTVEQLDQAIGYMRWLFQDWFGEDPVVAPLETALNDLADLQDLWRAATDEDLTSDQDDNLQTDWMSASEIDEEVLKVRRQAFALHQRFIDELGYEPHTGLASEDAALPTNIQTCLLYTSPSPRDS